MGEIVVDVFLGFGNGFWQSLSWHSHLQATEALYSWNSYKVGTALFWKNRHRIDIKPVTLKRCIVQDFLGRSPAVWYYTSFFRNWDDRIWYTLTTFTHDTNLSDVLQVCWRAGFTLKMVVINWKKWSGKKWDTLQLGWPHLGRKKQLQVWRMGNKK